MAVKKKSGAMTKRQQIAAGKRFAQQAREKMNQDLLSGEITQAQFNAALKNSPYGAKPKKKSGTTHKRQIARAKKANAIMWKAAEEVIQEEHGMTVQQYVDLLAKKAERSKKKIPNIRRKIVKSL
jgi:hypothetical protein